MIPDINPLDISSEFIKKVLDDLRPWGQAMHAANSSPSIRNRQTPIMAATLVIVACVHAARADYVVDTLADENDGVGTGGISLRDAINAANGAAGDDAITFSVTGTITLTGDLPNITSNITIDGGDADDMSIDGTNLYRAFKVIGSTTQVTIRNLTIANMRAAGGNGRATDAGGGGGGAAGMGAALFVNDGAVQARAMRFEGNTAVGGVGGSSASLGGVIAGGGGGGIGANAGSVWDGSDGGFLSGAGGTGGYPGATGGEGAGGGGGYNAGSGGSGGFGGGGGGTGINFGFGALSAGNGGFGGGGGGGGVVSGGSASGGAGGTFGGSGADGAGGSQGGGGGGAGLGGAIFVRAGTIVIVDSTFASNSAAGGSGSLGGTNGQGKGGAIFVNSGATALISGLSYSGNSASDNAHTTGDDNDVYGTLGVLPEVASITRAAATPTAASSVDFTVTFTVPVTGVNAADFAIASSGLSSASISSVSGSGTTYTVTVGTGTGDGTLGLNLIDDDSIIDGSSNPLGGAGTGNGSFTSGEIYSVDKTGPTITLSTSAANLLNTAFTVTAVTNEATTNFDASDISTTGAAAGNFSGSGTNYSFTITPLADGDVVVGVNINKFTDAVGNSNAASNTITRTFDGTAPTVTSMLPASFILSTETSTTFSIVFSEAVSGFDSGDVSITHSGTSSDTPVVSAVDAATYTVTVSNLSGSGTFNITIPAGAAADAAGNALAFATDSLFVSRTQPTTPPPADPDLESTIPETDDVDATDASPDDDESPSTTDAEGEVASETVEEESVGAGSACGFCGPVGFMPLITLASVAALKTRRRLRRI